MLEYLTSHVNTYWKELQIEDMVLEREEDLLKVDDTWLKVAKLMWDKWRLQC